MRKKAKTRNELITTIVRALIPNHPLHDDPDIYGVLLVEFECHDDDSRFLEALAAVAEIAITTDPKRYPVLDLFEDDAA